MSKKKDAPPRPPAPKLTLNKVGGRQGSVGSISVHYSHSMNDSNGDLDDDIVFDPGTSGNVSPASVRSKTRHTPQQQSRSAPSSEATTPVSTGQKLIGQSSFDQGILQPTQDVQFHDGSEKSLLSGLCEKFIGKIEEISSDTVFAEIVDRKLKKSDSMESSRSYAGGTSALDMSAAQGTDSRKTPTSATDSRKTPTSATDSRKTPTSVTDSRKTPTSASDSRKSPTSPHGGIAAEHHPMPIDAQPVQPKSRRAVHNDRLRTDTAVASSDWSESTDAETEMSNWHQSSDAATSGMPHSVSRDRMFVSKTNVDKTPMTLQGLLLTREDSDDIPSCESENVFFDTDDSPPTPTAAKVTKKPPTVNHQEAKRLTLPVLPTQILLAAAVLVLAYFVVPMPSFISGFFIGVGLTYCCMKLYQFVTEPSHPKEPFVIPDLSTLPPMSVPEMRESKNEDGKFKGWMNEVSKYDLHEYHINQSQSVFVQLEGSSLRLQRAHSRVPKRAMWNESLTSPVKFSPHQRFLNLTDAQVSLLPKGIVCKRLWSKKYPILIKLVASLQDVSSLDDLGDPDLSSEDINVDNGDPTVQPLYLFARSAREKEEWFWRFAAAASGVPLPTKMAGLLLKLQKVKLHGPSVTSIDSINSVNKKRIESNESDNEINPPDVSLNEDSLLAYMHYMARVMPMKQPGIPGPGKAMRLCEPNLVFLNAFIARFFWDFLREKFWVGKIQTKIQKKLSKIHVPYFIDELTVTGIEIGSEMPIIRRSTQPFLNDRGLWADLDITYNGGFKMSLETKVNLMKLKKMASDSSIVLENSEKKYTKGSAVLNSDEEDSGESSTDEEGSLEEKLTAETPDDKAGGKGKKLLRFVDKIAQSKYFQQVAEYKYIRKAMEEVSNTRLVLTVELKSLSGTLAINIPPPPTDRLWYGFRKNPRLWLSAKPKVGEREVNVSHITDWIEKKLAVEFQRVFVMPNMDDIAIPLMSSHVNDCEKKSQRDKTTPAR